MLKTGIIGLPNAGKSTLFNALVSKGKALTGKHPFTTIDKNVGVVPIPDSLLFDLAKLSGASKTTQANISFIDIAGLVKGAHHGEGLGNQFLAHIREVDMVLHVVRYFTDKTVPHIHPQIDPEENVGIVNTELMLADAESLKRQIERLNKKLKGRSDKELESAKAIAEKILKGLNEGKMASEVSLSDEEKESAKLFHLLTSKPIVFVANVDEKEISADSRIRLNNWITLCARFEEELSKLPWTEQRQFLKEYGVKQSALRLVIETCYKKLNFLTFYTIAGGKEVRAWTLKKGSTALDAAEEVHTDFAKHFIKAEVISADSLLKIGSWKAAHNAGKIQLVGKDYIVKDSDVVEFRVGL